MSSNKIPVPFYVPNILCYMRIILAYFGFYYYIITQQTSNPDDDNNNNDESLNMMIAFWCWILSASLDLFDGILARKLNQCSQLGILLDIAADNILRSIIWMAAAIHNPIQNGLLASVIISLEWTTMICTQLHVSASHGDNGNHWKECRDNDPTFLKLIFANNFKTPIGTLCVYGLFGLPFVLVFDEFFSLILIFYIAFLGRFITMIAEIWLCRSYLLHIIEKDEETKNQKKK